MRSTNPRLHTLLLVLAGGVAITATLAPAQQPSAPTEQAPPPAEDAPAPATTSPRTGPSPSTTTDSSTPVTPSATAPAAGEPDAPPPKPAAAKGSPQRFEPTEKVRPDFDVAFPIDI